MHFTKRPVNVKQQQTPLHVPLLLLLLLLFLNVYSSLHTEQNGTQFNVKMVRAFDAGTVGDS